MPQFEAKGKAWPRDPDGAPLYPGEERKLSAAGAPADARRRQAACLAARHGQGDGGTGRAADLAGDRCGQNGETGRITADPAAWGDVILSRSDAPSSYHLAVTMDDALQGVTHVVRGCDLYHATSVHRLLQRLLGLPEPVYHHHRLILGPDGRKLSKSNRDTGIAAFRDAGKTPDDVRAVIL